ncbi:Outer membrane protein HomA [Helicobacter bizzozeronii]|uniref:hypothetical protein n=1 Tax=Helicobacter bizzozeronii TaxID=56877 RepID=UPI00244D98B9|nr:hypothetical protein [Helicobacter bizzozeronii]GMB93615.1 Outer membrane protein HomA [Helicobacter bizzozeronii]
MNTRKNWSLGFFGLLGLLGEEIFAHPKDGYFVEGGLMTGLIETHERLEERAPCSGVGVICSALFMRNASPVFTAENVGWIWNKSKFKPVRFSTLKPISVSVANNAMQVKNMTAYNLKNVAVYMQLANGQKVQVATIEDLPQFTQSAVKLRYVPQIAQNGGNAQSEFSIAPSPTSDAETARMLQALEQITVNIQGRFQNVNGDDASGSWGLNTVEAAKGYTSVFLNMSYLFSSPEFKDAVLNTQFNFANGPGNESVAIPRNLNGTLQDWQIQYWLKNEDVYKRYISGTSPNWAIGVIGPNSGAVVGLGGPGVYGVKPNLLEFKNSDYNFGPFQNTTGAMDTILHEYGHVMGYGHDGNMTYPNGTFNRDEWQKKFNISVDKNNIPNGSWYQMGPNNYTPAGMIGVGSKVWAQLGRDNKLPINYDKIATMSAPTYLSDFMKSLENMDSTNISNKAAIVGFNLKGGYQQYWTNWFGLSYYGIFNYNFSKKTGFIKRINQVALGAGVDMLFDFTTTYTHQHYKNKKNTHKLKVIKSAFGIFGGLRALWKGYALNTIAFANSGNLDVTTGFNYRYKHSKYSIGVAIPLIPINLKAPINTSLLEGSLLIKEGPNHFNVFFNYGWIF